MYETQMQDPNRRNPCSVVAMLPREIWKSQKSDRNLDGKLTHFVKFLVLDSTLFGLGPGCMEIAFRDIHNYTDNFNINPKIQK